MNVLEQICAYINNHFTHKSGAPIAAQTGVVVIADGALTTIDNLPVNILKPGNYYLIRGSDFNDGIHQYPDFDLTDETFTGTIYKMCPPPDFLRVVDDIETWQQKYGEKVESPYQSENVIGVYSYQLKSTGMMSGDSTASWQNTFGEQLKRWRKLYDPAR